MPPVELDMLVNLQSRIGDDQDECRFMVMPVEVRQDDHGPAVLEGYGAVFNQDTQIGGDQWGFMERIAPGAFAQSIREDDIRSLFNHDSNQILGRTTAKTLTLEEDSQGLKVRILPPDTAAARDVVTLITRGDVNGMSFMFHMRKEEWAEPTGKGELPRRTLLEVKLIEVGPVTFPAYAQTSIAARDHVNAMLEARRRVEQDQQTTAVRTAQADSDRVRRLRLASARR